MSMNGIAIGFIPSSPEVNKRSVISIAISIMSIEMNDIPKAVERALRKSIWPRIRIVVSSITLVASQFIRDSIA